MHCHDAHYGKAYGQVLWWRANELICISGGESEVLPDLLFLHSAHALQPRRAPHKLRVFQKLGYKLSGSIFADYLTSSEAVSVDWMSTVSLLVKWSGKHPDEISLASFAAAACRIVISGLAAVSKLQNVGINCAACTQ